MLGWMALASVSQGQEQGAESLEEAQERIDKRVEELMDQDPSTAGMVKAIDWEQQEWDKVLNDSYQELLSSLPKEGQQALKEAQRAWIDYRDKQYKALGAIYSQTEGTMFIPMAANSRALITKHRAIELAGLVGILEIGAE